MNDPVAATVPEKPCIDCTHDYCRCAAQAAANVWSDPSISIGAKTAELTDLAVDALSVLFQDVPTDVLLAIADERDRIYAEGWIQRVIRDYIEAYR